MTARDHPHLKLSPALGLKGSVPDLKVAFECMRGCLVVKRDNALTLYFSKKHKINANMITFGIKKGSGSNKQTKKHDTHQTGGNGFFICFSGCIDAIHIIINCPVRGARGFLWATNRTL